MMSNEQLNNKLLELLQSTYLFQNFPFSTSAFPREPFVTWDLPLPVPLPGNAHYVTKLGIIPLDLGFWISTFILLSLQAIINMIVAALTYWFIVQAKTPHVRYLVCYGIMLPILLLLGPYICHELFEFHNLTLMLCLCGAIPNVLILRVVEATHDCLPEYIYAKKSLRMLVLYFCSTLKLQFDPKTQQPVPITPKILQQKLSSFISVFIQTSLLYSLLLPHNYQVFPHYYKNNPTTITTIYSLFYWGNLANAFLMASLTSLVLDGGATGLGLLTSMCTGYTMSKFSDAPLTKSTSPSDFWGNRWDRPVQSTLKRGCFLPLKKAGYSANVAAFGTFIVSGLIHEYVLWFMSLRRGPTDDSMYQPKYGNHMLFFSWNAMVIFLEKWLVSSHQHPSALLVERLKQLWLPQPIQTALVLLTVLPIAHLFTDEYIRSSFYSDAAWAFPLLVLS